MTRLLTWLFGRLPIGWLQLTHNPVRFASALAGVAFANILIFMQLGFLGALSESSVLPYTLMDADILISAPDANTLTDGSSLPLQRMYQSLRAEGVADVAPLWIGKLDWTVEDVGSVSLSVFGVDIRREMLSDALPDTLARLSALDTALLDSGTRNLPEELVAAISPTSPIVAEMQGRQIDILDTFTVGSGFESDGYMIVSEQTFLGLFGSRSGGAPNHILVELAPGANPAETVAALQALLPAADSMVRTMADALAADQDYQTSERPTGIVFGFGAVIGLLVGIVIVYQVLSTDVADHLAEYATLKAIGYRQSFFLGIVFEEALVLAIFGFIPGVLISLALYALVDLATGLPMTMDAARLAFVLFGTLVMCVASGAVATRRLTGADPADLF